MFSTPEKVEQALSPIGLLSILSLPMVYAIPVLGYLIETMAIFFVMLFAYRQKYLFLAIGGLGSLIIMLLLHGTSLMVINIWAKATIPGAILGSLIAAGSSTSRGFIFAILAMAGVAAIQYFGEKDLFFHYLDKLQLWIVAGIPSGSTAQTNETTDFAVRVITLFKRLLPSLLALSMVTQLFIGWILLVVFLKALGEFFPGLVGFYYWKMPDFYLYAFGLIIIIRLIGGEMIRMVADNLILFIGFFYAAFGFALFEYYLKKVRLSLFMRILFYIGYTFLMVPGLILAAVIGLFDSYFDFRNVKAKLIG